MSRPAVDDLELREIAGPSPLGGGTRRAVELLYLMAVTDFKRTYFGTALGYLWSICRPLLLFGVLLAVFTQVFRLGSDVPNYPVMLLLDLVLFTFFSEATSIAVVSVVGQEAVVRKTQFPRLVIPLAIVLTSLFNLALNLVVVFVFMLAYGVDPRWSWFGLVPIVLAIGGLTVAVSMLVSALYPRFRDVSIIWSVATTALLYATPVLYPLEAVGPTMRDIIALNPLAPIFSLTRKWITDPGAPGPVDASGGWDRVLIAVAIYVVICVVGVWVFRREAPRIAEQL